MTTTLHTKRIPNNANWSTMEHLGGWYAGHKFGTDAAYVDLTYAFTNDMGVITNAEFTVHNEVDTQIGTVHYSIHAPGDGWTFTKVGEVRIPLDEV